jgi:hypothetical protein
MPNMPMCCLVRNGHYKQHNHNDNTKEKNNKILLRDFVQYYYVFNVGIIFKIDAVQ